MHLRLLLCGIFALLQQNSSLPPESEYADSFLIKFVDPFGIPVPFRVAAFRDTLGREPDRSHEFRGGQIRHLASGKYQYQLVPEDRLLYLPAEGTVDVEVEKPNFGQLSLLVVEANRDWSTSLKHLDGPGIVLYGFLTGLPPNSFDQTWVTLLDAYTGEAVREAPVDETGHFVIGDIFDYGNCTLVICQNERVLAAQPVQIAMEGPYNYTLFFEKQ